MLECSRCQQDFGAKVKNRDSILDTLKECSKARDLQRGKKAHTAAIETGEDTNIYVGNTLLNMYAKCGSMKDGQAVFDKMQRRSVLSWNLLITGYVENGEAEFALYLFSRMRSEGITVDARSFVAALRACTILALKEEGQEIEGKLLKVGCLEKGMALHNEAAKNGCDKEIFVVSTLVSMYGRCGSMARARDVFESMQNRTVVSWNALILGYVNEGNCEEAFKVFSRMKYEGCTPTARTFVAILKACTSLATKENGQEVDGLKVGCLEKGISIYSQAAIHGCDSDIYVASSVIELFAKCGSMRNARAVFDEIPRHDLVCWTSLLLGYAGIGEGDLVLELFTRMHSEGCVPDARAFVAAMKACTGLAAHEETREVMGKFMKVVCLRKGIALYLKATRIGVHKDLYLVATLVDLCAKCGSMADAFDVFNVSFHDVVTWNALILRYANDGEGELALHMFAQMRLEGCKPDGRSFVAVIIACITLAERDYKRVKAFQIALDIHREAQHYGYDSDLFVASTLINMYVKHGKIVRARAVFDKMRSHDVVSWSTLLLGYAESGEYECLLSLFERMRAEGCAPDALAFAAALKACGSMAALETGRMIHADIYRYQLHNDVVVVNSLIDFYGKCGSMRDAQQVFDSFEAKNFMHWSSLIAGYSRQGNIKQVFDLFNEMQKYKLQITGITYLSLLTACSHAGLVDKGRYYFEMMSYKHRISPSMEHYHCMIDMLGRSNRLDEAVAMVENMPFTADSVTWFIILGACHTWANVVIGKVAFDRLLRLDSNNVSGACKLMANIYGIVGMWDAKLSLGEMNLPSFKGQVTGW